MKNNTVKSGRINYFVNLNHPIEIKRDKENGYFACIPDLPGCMTHANTFRELEKAIQEAKKGWIEIALEIGKEIPLPFKGEDPDWRNK